MPDPNATGGATQNTPAQGGEPTPEYATKDELIATLNSSVATHVKRGLDKAIAAALKDALGPAIEAAMAPLKEKLDKPKEEPGDSGGGKQKEDPQVTALKKQIDDMSTALKASQETADAERRKSQEQNARNSVRAALNGKVRPEALEDVVDLLFYRKRVGTDDQGNLTFTWRSALSKGLPEEDHQFPLEDGIAQFLKSKQAEIYLPPPNADKGGASKAGTKLASGSTLPATPRYEKPATTDEEKLRRAMEITAALEARGVAIGNP